jgi:histidinol-phosphate aminotransferase
VWQGLVDRSVLVRDCSGWPRLTDCLRVTVGLPDENDAFLAALGEVLGEMPVRPTPVGGTDRQGSSA